MLQHNAGKPKSIQANLRASNLRAGTQIAAALPATSYNTAGHWNKANKKLQDFSSTGQKNKSQPKTQTGQSNRNSKLLQHTEQQRTKDILLAVPACKCKPRGQA